jgi:hypothetical protein
MIDQRVDVIIGNVAKPRMPAFKALPHGAQDNRTAVAAGSLPYTIYYGNLHSQTNHSDGGTPVGSCGGSEIPQGGTMGPAEAYAMMQNQAGGDFLLTSEHNHMYDGSTSTNTSATPAQANNLFNSGITAAASYRSAHPGFLALYGNEWGVISNGGHLNILNPDGLAELGIQRQQPADRQRGDDQVELRRPVRDHEGARLDRPVQPPGQQRPVPDQRHRAGL